MGDKTMRSLTVGAWIAAISATLLTGCSTSPSSGEGGEVFSGTISALDPYCEEFNAGASALLSTLQAPYPALVSPETDSSSNRCRTTAQITDVLPEPPPSVFNSYGTASLTLSVLEDDVDTLDSRYIAPTFPEKMIPINDLMDQYKGTVEEAKIVLPEQFSAAGWTYAFDSLTSAYPNRGAGEISLVLTTKQSVLECAYYAPTEARLSQDAVAALCNEFRGLVYTD